MSHVVIDVQKAEDTRDIVHRAVQALAEGRVVAFPTETVYGLAASTERPDAVSALRALKGNDKPMSLAVKSADAALDYVPAISSLGRRLARRCWPGPVTLILADSHPDSLLKRMPVDVQREVSPADEIGIRVPAHPLLLDVLRLSSSPVVLTNASSRGGEACRGEDVISAFPQGDLLVLDDGPSRFQQPSSVVQVAGNRWRLLRSGVINEARMKWFANMLVLFVCTGNTCRSPMAELLMKSRVAERLGCKIEELDERGVMVMSAGIAAMQGGGSSPEAVEVMSDRGLDLSQHSSQPLSEQLVRFADHIITMTRGHRHAIVSRWPEASARVSVLCGDESDVSDPIGGPLELYAQCAEQIDSQLSTWLERLQLDDLPAAGGADES